MDNLRVDPATGSILVQDSNLKDCCCETSTTTSTTTTTETTTTTTETTTTSTGTTTTGEPTTTTLETTTTLATTSTTTTTQTPSGCCDTRISALSGYGCGPISSEQPLYKVCLRWSGEESGVGQPCGLFECDESNSCTDIAVDSWTVSCNYSEVCYNTPGNCQYSGSGTGIWINGYYCVIAVIDDTCSV